MTSSRLRLPAAALGIMTLAVAAATAAGPEQSHGDSPARLAQTQAAPPSPSAAGEAQAWHKLSGPQQSFSAEMPAAPNYTAKEMRSAAGSVYTMHQYLLEHGDVAYVAQTAVYPPDVNVSNHRTNLQGGLIETGRIPHRPETSCYQWAIAVEPEDRLLVVRELFELPGAADQWNTDPKLDTLVTSDRSRSVTQFEDSLDDGIITHGWCVAEGDPTGPHRIRVYAGDRLLHEFRFEVVGETY